MERLRSGAFVQEVAPGTLQVGSRPHNMVILSNLSPADIAWVQSLREPASRKRRAQRRAAPTKKQAELLGYLDAADLLAPRRPALQGLAVRIIGLDRVGARIAVLLAEAGVEELDLRDRHSVDSLVEAAYPLGCAGEVRQTALRAQIRRRRPGLRIGTMSTVDLVVVSGKRAWDHGTLGRLLSEDQVHLPITQDCQSVTIAPLIAPGVTACALCVDLHQQDRYPHWARASFALAAAPSVAPPDHLCVAAAGLAVSMLSAVASGMPLEGEHEAMGRIGGSSQSWTVTHSGVLVQTWQPHTRCTCLDSHLESAGEQSGKIPVAQDGAATVVAA